jgi:hypothetical protein
MKKSVLTIAKTTSENASLSWKDDLNNMITKYPICATLYGFAGGFFESLPQAHNFLNDCLKKHGYVYKKIDNAFNENCFGTWDVSVYTEKEINQYGWDVVKNI